MNAPALLYRRLYPRQATPRPRRAAKDHASPEGRIRFARAQAYPIRGRSRFFDARPFRGLGSALHLARWSGKAEAAHALEALWNFVGLRARGCDGSAVLRLQPCADLDRRPAAGADGASPAAIHGRQLQLALDRLRRLRSGVV